MKCISYCCNCCIARVRCERLFTFGYLRLHLQSKEAYVTWTKAEIEYTKKAYDIIYAQLPLDQKRFISKEVLKHIRN
jgi:hypothetical protein